MFSNSKLIVIMCLYNGLAAMDYLQCTENSASVNKIRRQIFTKWCTAGKFFTQRTRIMYKRPASRMSFCHFSKSPNLGHPTVALVPLNNHQIVDDYTCNPNINIDKQLGRYVTMSMSLHVARVNISQDSSHYMRPEVFSILKLASQHIVTRNESPYAGLSKQ
ncbi:hypothetical protein NQ318_021558 [Aromia moschata]|uniref:Uncharacterized protein n=1 Tax=Aromia moschata TaxID=1265417 RepID=A0AAV8YI78_9CUCU|nr:hypothetical protein NQ318_021558 [Aromia moschata]